jgi:hypothetical protein
MAMRNNILALQAAGSTVIVDDILWPNEPMFQDGIIAQAVDQVVNNNGVTYVSAAGNAGVVSYQSAFNAGTTPIVYNIGGTSEVAHQFAAGDATQRVTIPMARL